MQYQCKENIILKYKQGIEVKVTDKEGVLSHRFKGFNNIISGEIYTYLIVLLIILIGVVLKLSVLSVGAPYVTIDDQTLYEAGFLVWFGQPPPQRVYLESWLVGISNILTYIGIALESGKDINSNIVALAYQSFHQNPDPFVTTYRIFIISLDAMTAFIIFQSARLITTPKREINFIAIGTVAFYVLSFNTLWCYIVARPDILTVFFSSLGMFYYLRAVKSENSNHFWLSAIAFGLATGMKLHAGYFVFLVILDRMRVVGFWSSLQIIIPFGIISVVVFAVSAGSPLFDPLLYVKLRMLNMIDDASPWLHWGDQIWTTLRGTGWVIVPILIAATIQTIRFKHWRSSSTVVTLAVFTLGWLLLFLSIRQLRAYWMLPALPVFYLFAVSYLGSFKDRYLKVIVSAIVIILILADGFGFYTTPYQQRPRHEDYRWLRPAGDFGHGAGIIGTLMMLFMLLYSVRKRTHQNGIPEYILRRISWLYNLFVQSLIHIAKPYPHPMGNNPRLKFFPENISCLL